jgi:hypothetical protein
MVYWRVLRRGAGDQPMTTQGSSRAHSPLCLFHPLVRRWPWLLLGGVLLAFVALVGTWAYELRLTYRAAMPRIDRLRELAGQDPSSLSVENLMVAQSDLQNLRAELERLDAATTPPLGESLLPQLPWLGERYTALRAMLHIGVLAADAGTTATEIGQDLLRSIEAGGALRPTPDGAPTWFAVLASRQQQLAQAAHDVEAIRAVRSTIDERVLPDRFQTQLDQLDRILDRSLVQTLTTVDIPAVMKALGGSAPARYLVLFQNPAELRPTGGFPGTAALLTIAHGQVQSYEFFDIHELTRAYMASRQTHLPQPWPIEQFFPQDGFLLHDALWWPDFPRSAEQFIALYAETGWPPIDGVIAVQPEVAGDLLRVTGSFDIDFDGQLRQITPDNFIDQIDRERRAQGITPPDRLVHKDLLGLIGKKLIERLVVADRQAVLGGLVHLAAKCQTRDLQIYATDPAVQSELDRHQCTGRLAPITGEPTLAVTYANLVLAKTSLDMRPRLALRVEQPKDGQREVTLDIDLRNGTVADEDLIYAGFQRWWVEVRLPDGSTLLSDPGPMHDPDAPNGGSYLAALFPNQTGRVSVRFTMPDTPSMLVRRQPGVRPGDVVVSQFGCEPSPATELDHDLRFNLSALCRSARR